MTFTTESVDWERSQNRLKALREKVFVLEWRLPPETEFDEHDPKAYHALVYDPDKEPIATARLTPQGEIGRVAVKRQHRHLGVYKVLFKALIQLAKTKQLKIVKVNLSLDSVPYHTKLGFEPVGQVFMDAGIPRQRMGCSTERFSLPDVSKMH